jgi:hypothetical protein
LGAAPARQGYRPTDRGTGVADAMHNVAATSKATRSRRIKPLDLSGDQSI